MSIAEPLLTELEAESVATRKVLERIPDDKFEWSPHEKSMAFDRLASHVADIPGWVALIVEQDELVLGPDTPAPEVFENVEDLVADFETKMEAARISLRNASDETLTGNWKMKMGDQVLIDSPRFQVLRTWVLSHLIHHRAQLSVYLRLNDVPVPAIYGASADEQEG
jgi:uncharacterized damage-inducible protein DinB